MKIRNSKKGIEMVPSTIIVFIIVIVVLVMMIFIFRRYLGKETDVLEEQINSLGDEDGDGIKNFLDRCPCTCGVSENDGCPVGESPPKSKPSSCEGTLDPC